MCVKERKRVRVREREKEREITRVCKREITMQINGWAVIGSTLIGLLVDFGHLAEFFPSI